jgi:hypothetical protein
MRLTLAVAIAAALSGCATCPAKPEPIRIVQPVRVEVPVPVRREPPVELFAPVAYPAEALPQFVAPADPQASSALTPEGERRLRALLIDLTARLAAWREWAAADSPASAAGASSPPR